MILKNNFKKISIAVLVASSLMLSACGESSNSLYLEAENLRLAATSGNGEMSAAIEKYEEASTEGSVEASLFLTKYYFDLKQFEKVIQYSRMIAVDHPGEFTYYNGLVFLSNENPNKNLEGGIRLLKRSDEANMPLAAFELGNYYYSINDIQNAQIYLKKALKNNDFRAIRPLATLYVNEDIQPSNKTDVFNLLQKAKKQTPDDATIDLLLAYCYLEGYGTQTDLNKVQEIVNKYVSDKNNLYAKYLQAKLRIYKETEQDLDMGINQLKNLAVQSQYSLAAYDLYKFYKDGLFGLSKSAKDAVYYARIAQKNGYTKAYIALANIYLEGDGVEPNPVDSFNFAKQAYDLSPYSTDAVLLLGRLYAEGIGTQRNDVLGYQLINKAVSMGSIEAEILKAIMIYTGRSADGEVKDAVEIFKRYAQADNKVACYYYGLMMYEGRVVPKDFKEAVYYFEKSLNQGYVSAEAEFYLAHAYDQLNNLPKSLNWYQKVASSENAFTAEANARLGEIYSQLNDYSNSISFYQKAANLNHNEATYNLGLAYYELKEYDKAYSYFKKISSTVKEAATIIGFMYQLGQGFEKNDIKALEWYDKAIAMGSSDAIYQKAVLLKTSNDVPEHLKKEVDNLFLKAACSKQEEALLYLGTNAVRYADNSLLKKGFLAYAEHYTQSSRAAALLKNLNATEEDRINGMSQVKLVCMEVGNN